MAILYQERDSSYSTYEEGPGPIGLGRYHEEETVVTKRQFRWLRFCNWFHNKYEQASGIFYKISPLVLGLSVESVIYAYAPNPHNAAVALLTANTLALIIWIGYKIRNH